jgi:hypothetical protein
MNKPTHIHTHHQVPNDARTQVEDGKCYDMAADIYSFGVLCAVVIALESPWHMDARILAEVIGNYYPKKVCVEGGEG